MLTTQVNRLAQFIREKIGSFCVKDTSVFSKYASGLEKMVPSQNGKVNLSEDGAKLILDYWKSNEAYETKSQQTEGERAALSARRCGLKMPEEIDPEKKQA